MKKRKLAGLVAATHTPLTAGGALNLAIVEQQASHLLAHGVLTAFVGGSTGECHSLSVDERHQLARRWMEVVRGTRLQVIVHVGSNCIVDSRALAAQAEKLGAWAIAALAPSYFKPSNLTALIDCCAEIAGAAPNTPFYFYDIPALAGVHFSMPDFLAKAHGRIPNLAGIKFTNSDLMAYQLCLRANGGEFDGPYGVDEQLLAALALGAQSAVGSSFNFAAPIYQRLIAAFKEGDLETAREEQFRSVQVIHLLAKYGYLGAAKALMKMIGVDVGPTRLPNGNPTPQQVVMLRQQLEEMGFFDWIQVRNIMAGPDRHEKLLV